MLNKEDRQVWRNSDVTKELLAVIEELRESVNINQADLTSVEKSGIKSLVNCGYISAIDDVIYEIESMKDKE